MLAHSGHVMTLANSIIGVGILAMPFCFLKCGILLSIVLLVVSNWVTRLCCNYLIKASLLTRRKSFEFLGFHAFGPPGKLLVELCIIGYLLGTCITYFVVVGDLGPQIVTKMLSLNDGHSHLRTIFMVAVTVVCILPLGMLKNVDSLSTVCTASIGFYFCLVVKIILESKEHIVAHDWTDQVVYWRPAGVLQCLPIFSMALSCQMQLFEVFGSVSNQSLEKLNGIVRNATWICTFVYIAVGFFGYVAFCTQTFAGNILLNFSPTFSSDVIKIGFILSVAFSFPLVIFPCRASIYSLLYRKGHTDATGYIPEGRFKAITIFIVGLALCIALMIPSVELIIGLVGSTIGVAICIMFPAGCFRKIVRKESMERMSTQLVLVSGFCLMILGTYANLSAIDERRSGTHLTSPLKAEAHLPLPPVSPEKLMPNDQMELLAQQLKQTEMELKLDIDKSMANAAKKPAEAAPAAPEPPTVVKSMEPLPLGKMSEPPGPPLPVDDIHDQAAPEVAKEQPPPEQPMKNAKELEKLPPAIEAKELPASSAASPVAKESPALPQKQQNIDREAIKKDEDMTVEESKVNDVVDDSAAKAKEDELKETQKELKKTKELLVRTVGELKEELAKQNKETQDLVVEKLGEVVERVEEMERKVQSAEADPLFAVAGIAPAAPAAKPALPQQSAADEQPAARAPGSLLSRLGEKSGSSGGAKATSRALPAGQVYEPLSYKTGELAESAKNGSRTGQRLALPLALLINAAQAKMNASQAQPVDEAPAKIPEPRPKQTEATQVTAKREEPPAKTAAQAKEAEKENVDAIRRDILQLDAKRMRELTTISSLPGHSASLAAAARFKREADEHAAAVYLAEPKLEMLMGHGAALLDLKMQGVGRELKAISGDDEN